MSHKVVNPQQISSNNKKIASKNRNEVFPTYDSICSSHRVKREAMFNCNWGMREIEEKREEDKLKARQQQRMRLIESRTKMLFGTVEEKRQIQ